MSILTKALQAAAQLKRRGPTQDVAATIRSALASAGLMADGKLANPDPLGCMAPAGAPTVLGGFAPDWRRVRGLMPSAAAPAQDDSRFTWHSIAGSWGVRRYKLFVPDATEPAAALVVMLHGCSQNPDDFAAGTRMNTVAAEHNVIVAYPEQTRSANMSSCWNWFDAAHQRRGAGEPALIAAIARTVMAEHGIPAGRAFVAGLSAGGAMAAVLAETDGDLFTAVGIHSGLPYLAATDVPSAFAAMQGNAGAARGAGNAVRDGVPTIVFHGDADRTVNISNADGIVAGLSGAGLRRTAEQGTAAGGRAYVRSIGRDGAGRVLFEDWRIAGAGHAWSGGNAAGSYTDPAGPDASREMMRFFLEQVGTAGSVASPALTGSA